MMRGLTYIIETIWNAYNNPILNTTVIASVLLMVLILGIYEFAVYRLVSHRAFYNRSFNICIAILPFFISTIILCLQSNLVITLGTIGALAIIRFRTAIKDPVDMLYLLWSVHIGITCGCQLFEVAVLTSIAVTVVLLVLEHVSFGRKPFILVFYCQEASEREALQIIQGHAKKYRVKSRNYTGTGMNYVLEVSVKNPQNLTEALRSEKIEKFSIIEYDSDDIL